MDIKGWVRTSLIDFPGHIAAVVFTGRCSFRCPMCHNGGLVLRSDELPTVDQDEVLGFLRRRAGKVTGLVVTGGEPTLQTDLADFLREVRATGCAVKLDTNGYQPDVLDSLLAAGLVDFVAMDVKAPPGKYDVLAGVPSVDMALVTASIALLADSSVPVEFRTTVVPGLLTADDVEAIAIWLSELGGGGAAYALQQFRSGSTLDPALTGATPYASGELRAMADRVRRWLPAVWCRGI